MRINDYVVIDPKGSKAGAQLEELAHAHPLRTDRLVQCLEEFVRTNTDLSCSVVGSEIEFFLVPPRYVLAHVPDSAALVRVSHQHKRIDIVAVIEEYGGFLEQAQWDDVKRLALEIIETDSL